MLKEPIWFSLGTDGSGLTAQEAWQLIENYKTMATIQLQRIGENNYYDAAIEANETALQESFKLGKDEMIGIKEVRSSRSTCDAHFYLNCWRIVALNAYRIAKSIGDQRLFDFLSEQNCPTSKRGDSLWFGGAPESVTLGWYAQGRDHFEHIDERIYGGKYHEKTRVDSKKLSPIDPSINMPEDARYYPSPWFNGRYMIVGESKWEITPGIHKTLCEAVEKLHTIGLEISNEQATE